MRRVALASAATVALVTVVTPSSQAASIAGLQYVALGDSYSAASGNLPPDLTAAPECARSTVNYPHVIAAATGATLIDATCGGATTGDYFTSQYQGVAPQLNALSASTRLVTMTIGGNDSGVFINTIEDCGLADATSLGFGNACQQKYGTSFVDTINNVTEPSLEKALNAVHAAAPHARVAIIGYPLIMPPTGGCYPQMPIASGDVPYVYNIQLTLNAAIAKAAAATDTIYVNMNAVSAGHDACKPIGTRWIEPVLFGTNPVIVHPNALGEAQMAAQTEAVLHLG
jgi:lysophospholipase L1-like esterase